MTLTKTNPITLLTADLHSEDVPAIYCLIINALTGAVVTNIMRALTDKRINGVPHTDIPTIDERNEQDEDARGQDVEDAVTQMQGFSVHDTAMHIADICDGIRYHLYQEMHGFGEFDEDKYLIINKPHNLHAKLNYNQPMSAQRYIEFRIDVADKLNEAEIAIHAKRMNKPAEIIRAALMQEAIRNKQRLIAMKPNVLAEVNSLEGVYDEDAFTGLDIEVQCGIVQKISEKLDNLYTRTLPRALRSLEVAAELDRIEHYHKQAKQWLLDNDAELQHAMLIRKAA